LSALQTYCETVLRVPLSSLCSAPYALEPSVAERHDISNEDNAGPTTGPAPSSWTATVEHSINAPAWTYALRFGDRQLWKVGQAEDLVGRLNDVRRHVPEEVLHEQWRMAFRQRWADATLAHRMEQKIFELLATRRTIGERIKCSELELETAWTAAAAAIRANRR
jgi:hypothetical protein